MIHHISRGEILFSLKGKKYSVQGEALLPGHGSPDFVIYSNTLKQKKMFKSEVSIEGDENKQILSELVKELEAEEYKIEVE